VLDLSVEFTVSINPQCNPNDIQLTATRGANKVTIDEVFVGEREKVFKVTGRIESAANDDVTLTATYQGSTKTHTLTVVRPKSVGSPRPMDDDKVPASAVNLAMNEGTKPPGVGVNPPFMYLAVAQLATLTVQVLDQLDQPLKGYKGVKVLEDIDFSSVYGNTNQELSESGQYSDPTGALFQAPPPYNVITDDKDLIKQWLEAQPSFPAGPHPPVSVHLDIEIDGWKIDAGRRWRAIVDKQTMHIKWP
jgi:hypothetical protein